MLSLMIFALLSLISPTLAQDIEAGDTTHAPATDLDGVTDADGAEDLDEATEPGATAPTLPEDTAGLQDGQISTTEVADTVQQLIAAGKAGQWTLVAALVLALLVWGLRTFALQAMPKKYVPYVVVGAGGAITFSAAIFAGGDLTVALISSISGLVLGLSSIGLWELVLKKLLKRDENESPSE